MVGFFDLNIPYLESPSKPNSIEKAIRLKLIVKAMELGYTGIAYNHSIKGVMSESDRVSKTTSFRQYTRLTVVVDTSVQAAALNSGNPVLKTYDIVAVKPLNQNAFEQACQISKVDLIAIDFSEKLPFRLRQPLVKAAIERGVYFEITYSSLVMDVQARRQLISSAKMLVDWTKGKNLIFSSAAPSLTELRGPYDVANLMTILGITMERAKESISKNCRSLIADSIRKKKFYKEAIKVELVTKDPEFDEWLKWDPISNGEGDLLLDDMAKSFNASSKESIKMKAINFASVIDSLPANGLQIKDMVPFTKPALDPLNSCNNLFSIKKISKPVDVPRAPKSDQASARDQSSVSTNFKNLSAESLKGFTMVSSGLDHELNNVQLQTCTNICETHVVLQIDTLEGHAMQPERDMPTCQAKSQIDALESHDMQTERDMPTCQTKYPEGAVTINGLSKENEIANTLSKEKEIAKDCNALADTQISTMLVDHNLSSLQSEQCKQLNSLDLISFTQDAVMDELSNEENIKVNAGDTVETLTVSKDYSSACASELCLCLNNADAFLATPDEISFDTDMKYKPDLHFASDLSLHECTMIREQVKGTGDGGEASILDESSVLEFHVSSLATNPISDTPMKEQKQIENQYGTEHHVRDSSQLGTRRKKRKTSLSARLFPFRHLWNPVQFKKNARTSKRKIVTRNGLSAHLPVGKQLGWAEPILLMEEKIGEALKKKDKKMMNGGLLEESQRLEKVAVFLVEYDFSGAAAGEEEDEMAAKIGELAEICKKMDEGLGEIQKEVRQVFHRIANSRIEVLAQIAIGNVLAQPPKITTRG